MDWFNVFGAAFTIILLIPNAIYAIYAIFNKDGIKNKQKNSTLEIIEQIGRFGCIAFMMFNIPGTCFGLIFENAFMVYVIVDMALVMIYCLIWVFCFKKNSMFRALSLSIIPSVIFLFSGIMIRSVLLIMSSVLFAPSHILISYKNAK